MSQEIKEQTLTEHLIELRNRLAYSAVAVLLAFFLSYYFAQNIYDFLLQPLLKAFGEHSNKRIIYTNLTEAFITYLRLSLTSAVFFAFPFIASQLYLFIAPALYKKEKKFVLAIMFFCPLLFLLGSIIVYKLVYL